MERSYMIMVRAVKRLMLSLREEAQPVKLDRTIEIDEVCVAAGLKGRNNSPRIKSVGRMLRRRSFERRGSGTWDHDKPAIFVLVERIGLLCSSIGLPSTEEYARTT